MIARALHGRRGRAPAPSSSWRAPSGLLRFPDPPSRLHALTKADNLGLGLVVLGLLPHAGALGAAKLVAVWLLAQLAATTVTQLLGRATRRAAGRRRERRAPSSIRCSSR